MSVQVKTKKARVFSARNPHSQADKQRPFSGITSQTFTRKQLIQNTYVGQITQPSRIISARSNRNKYVSAPIQEEKMPYRPPNKQNRQKQQMAQQISTLKLTMNRLVQQLSHQRAKVEAMRKKNTKFQKILTMQFQDEKQWSSNKISNHLVSGIKTMYESMKQKYEMKCKEYNSLITTIQATKILEYQIYIKSLQQINKQLSFKLNTISNQAAAMAIPNQTQKNASQYVIAQLTIQKQRLNTKLKQIEGKFKKANQGGKDMSLKIQFLEKLIIQKDNNIHAMQRKIKKSTAEFQKLNQDTQNINKQYSDLKLAYKTEKQQLTRTINEIQIKNKNALQSLRSQKDYKIDVLQTNNAYVQEMLTEIRKTNTQLNRQLQQVKYLNSKNIKIDKTEHKQVNIKKNILQKEQLLRKPIVQNNDFQGERKPQKANKRHSQEAVKKRKIQLNEVLQIAELIRYKLIYQRISIQKLKKMFDFDSSKSATKNVEWQSQYITMQEVIAVLQNQQINLIEQHSILLARYLIQDVQEQYVYCDQLNENHREVVKSIMKTLIQEYPLYQNNKINQLADEVLRNYGKSLKQIFKIHVPNGFISKTKFYDILSNLGIATSNEVKQYLVAKMSLKSQGINSLMYKQLFDQS